MLMQKWDLLLHVLLKKYVKDSTHKGACNVSAQFRVQYILMGCVFSPVISVHSSLALF